MTKEKVLKLVNAISASVMDVQRTRGCVMTKANYNRTAKALVEFGLSKEDAVWVVNNQME